MMEAMKQIAKEDEGALYYPEFQIADEMETSDINNSAGAKGRQKESKETFAQAVLNYY